MLNEIICGDSLKVMRGFESDSVDLTVTSPPYDNLRDYKGYTFDFEGIARELYRVTKDGGVVVWVVGDQTTNGSESGTSFKQALYFKEIGFNLHDTMIYYKGKCIFPDENRYYASFEYMFIFSKGIPKTFNPINDRINKSFGRKITGTDRRRDGSTKRKSCFGNLIDEKGRRFNVWEITDGVRQSAHPAVFPEALARDHILSWSNEGDLVLDPFLGSGTTAKMAHNLKRNYIGIDISEEYCEIARARLKGQSNPLL
jgi:site-specific DNA-methyltransferase (adenine-specific)